jgi:RNA polymerase primary sigma factor
MAKQLYSLVRHPVTCCLLAVFLVGAVCLLTIRGQNAPVPPDAVAYGLMQDQLHEMLQSLTEREAEVVKLRFGLADGQPHTLDEIGKELGLTRERIRQIESKTLSKLRHPSRSQKLRDYLD